MVGNDQTTVTGHADHTFWLSNLEVWSTTEESWGRDANNDWLACRQSPPSEGCGTTGPYLRVPVCVELVEYADDCASVTFEIGRDGMILETHTLRVAPLETVVIETRLPPGLYDLSAKEWHRLRRVRHAVEIGPNMETIRFPPLDRAGDANDDNVIDDLDAALVEARVGSTYERLCAVVPPGTPAVGQEEIWQADVDGDGRVTEADSDAVSAHQGQIGESL
jgi:hypothetical protein